MIAANVKVMMKYINTKSWDTILKCKLLQFVTLMFCDVFMFYRHADLETVVNLSVLLTSLPQEQVN